MKVEYGKISNGVEDVAKYLGLDPKKTIFLHSTTFGQDTIDGKRRPSINKGRMIYSEIMSYSSNKKDGTKTAVSYIEKNLLDYYHNSNIIDIENIIQVGEEKKIEYPYNSVSYMLNKKLKEDEDLRKRLGGYTIVSSFLSEEDIETAKLINGKTLMGLEEQLKFNSKYFFRKASEKHNFSVPSGVCFEGLKNIEEAINELKSKIKDKVEIPEVWIKLESQLSGTGNIKVNLESDLNEIIEKINDVAKKVYTDEYIYNEIPLIIEVDVNSLNDEKQVENIGVEAVVTKNKITILGGVSQETQNGKYLGSARTEKTDKYIGVAQEAAKDAFIAYAEEGYCGFITIDVLVVENEKTGEVKGYNIDPNARFSAGTMLLRNIHMAEEKSGKTIYGLSFSNALKLGENPMESIEEYAKDNLYSGEKTGYVGIIPVVLNNVMPIVEDRYYLKTVVLGYSYEDALKRFNEFKAEIVRSLKK